jgi:hypothetical protein
MILTRVLETSDTAPSILTLAIRLISRVAFLAGIFSRLAGPAIVIVRTGVARVDIEARAVVG